MLHNEPIIPKRTINLKSTSKIYSIELTNDLKLIIITKIINTVRYT